MFTCKLFENWMERKKKQVGYTSTFQGSYSVESIKQVGGNKQAGRADFFNSSYYLDLGENPI